MPPTVNNPERLSWSLSRNDVGHRSYKISWLVRVPDPTYGPGLALNAPGIPLIGAPWIFGAENDPWAFCLPTATVKPHIVANEPNVLWVVDQTFSTIPMTRCSDTSITDPLAEPPTISGNFVRFQKMAQRDRNNALILSSSFEPITGIEKDASRPSVEIGLNDLVLDLGTITQMIDTLNDAPLWGLSKRKVKLSSISWSRKLFGTCNFYYTKRFNFEVRFEGFDLDDVVDKGFKKFRDEMGDDRQDPNDYVVAKDLTGENPPQAILLDGNGSPLADPLNPHFLDTIELYDESNFLSLGIPSSF